MNVAETTKPSWTQSLRVFLRGIGLVYAVAFISLALQVEGLIGEIGILPATSYFTVLSESGVPWWRAPSLFRVLTSDAALIGFAWGGAAMGVAIMLGVLQGPLLLLSWGLYFSFVVAGQDFFSFQWDLLLLEAGFVATVIAPWSWREKTAAARSLGGCHAALVLWLLFRLMLQSGWVKLASGDLSWRDLTALDYHFETQPLPNQVAWLMHHAPAWTRTAAVIVTFLIELVVPWLIFAPRRVRRWAFAPLLFLQVGIVLTGNYGFFNLLTVVLCLPLLDDENLKRLTPRRYQSTLVLTEASPSRWRLNGGRIVLVGAVTLGLSQLAGMFGLGSYVPAPIQAVQRTLAPYFLVNRYGLFAVMTKTRPEIILEGSRDGVAWQTYEFKFKIGDTRRAPPFIPLHMPRLDWQMWFAALGSHHQNAWFVQLAKSLLEGSQPVSALLEHDPFGKSPPRFVRALGFAYKFATPEERAKSGDWWTREQVKDYLPAASLR